MAESGSNGPSEGSAPFTQAQLEAMLKILDSQRTHGTSDQVRATMASTGMRGKSHCWIVDSGATNHMTFNKSILENFTLFNYPKIVRIANGDNIDILGCVNVQISHNLILKYVLYVPGLDCNLISVKQLMTDNKCWTMFSPNQCSIFITYFLMLSRESSKGEYFQGDDWQC